MWNGGCPAAGPQEHPARGLLPMKHVHRKYMCKTVHVYMYCCVHVPACVATSRRMLSPMVHHMTHVLLQHAGASTMTSDDHA